MSSIAQHWTSKSYADFVFRIASDFVAQIEAKLENTPMDRKEFAKKLGVGRSRVSQIFNNPGNLGLESIVRSARALGMKVAIVAYDDDDPDNERGPILPHVFSTCWERAGRPSDMFALEGRPAMGRLYQEVASQGTAFYRPKFPVAPVQAPEPNYFPQAGISLEVLMAMVPKPGEIRTTYVE